MRRPTGTPPPETHVPSALQHHLWKALRLDGDERVPRVDEQLEVPHLWHCAVPGTGGQGSRRITIKMRMRTSRTWIALRPRRRRGIRVRPKKPKSQRTSKTTMRVSSMACLLDERRF